MQKYRETVMNDYTEVRAARRRLENRIRTDCADLQRAGADPEELEIALQATREFWLDELQDIGE